MKLETLVIITVLFLSPITLFVIDSDTMAKEVNYKNQQPPTSAEEICPILVGTAFPELTFKTVKGGSFDLLQAIKEKPTILVYYRGGW